MPSAKTIKKANPLAAIKTLIDQGFSLEVGPWPDTPVGKEDQLLSMDARGHVLIARAPLNAE